jgi:hypothetical protein
MKVIVTQNLQISLCSVCNLLCSLSLSLSNTQSLYGYNDINCTLLVVYSFSYWTIKNKKTEKKKEKKKVQQSD